MHLISWVLVNKHGEFLPKLEETTLVTKEVEHTTFSPLKIYQQSSDTDA